MSELISKREVKRMLDEFCDGVMAWRDFVKDQLDALPSAGEDASEEETP